MEHLIKMDDLGGFPPIFGSTPKYLCFFSHAGAGLVALQLADYPAAAALLDAMQKSSGNRVDQLLILRMVIPPLIGNPYNGYTYIIPYYWVDEFIPYYMEIMGV